MYLDYYSLLALNSQKELRFLKHLHGTLTKQILGSLLQRRLPSILYLLLLMHQSFIRTLHPLFHIPIPIGSL